LIAAVVLAAGLARRMGRQKLLLALHGKPVVRWSVEAILPLVDEVLVVTGHDGVAVRGALEDLAVRFAENPHPDGGQGSSIAVGVRALRPGTRAALVVLGDQPHVPVEVPRGLIEAMGRTGKSIVAPVYRGTQGTPVLFASDVFAELASLTGDGGARSVVQAHGERVERVAFDLAMPADVDTPEDYRRLRVQ
jgi:molybdenum cofactor cytidylyltransferase